jgi:hypothetical protein
VSKLSNHFLICFLCWIAEEIGQEIIVINKMINETVLVTDEIFNKSADEKKDVGLGVGGGNDGREVGGVFFDSSPAVGDN